MSLRFEKRAAESGKKHLAWGISVLMIFIALQFFVFSRSDFPIAATVFAWLIGGLIILMSLSTGLSLLRSGGKWTIVIDNKGITWDSPNESVDKSFNLLLKEIGSIVLRYRKRRGAGRGFNRPDYIVTTKSGVEFELSPNSGVNLQMVFAELERNGIELVTEHI